MEPRFSDDGVVLYLEYDEAPTLEEWIAMASALSENPRWHEVTAVIVDRSGVAPPTADFVRGVTNYVRLNEEEFRGFRFALVVRDQASLGMARMGQTLLEQQECEVEIFKDMAKAEAWARRETSTADRHQDVAP